MKKGYIVVGIILLVMVIGVVFGIKKYVILGGNYGRI